MSQGKAMMKTAFNKDMVQMIVDSEPKKEKNKILCVGICTGVIVLIFMALYLARLDTVVRVQADLEDSLPPGMEADRNFYDQCGCDTYWDADGKRQNCMYTDPIKAAELAVDIAIAYAGEDYKAGTMWSVAFAFNGFLFVAILVNFLCVCAGAYKAIFRMLGALCACCLCCVHLIAIIVTAITRFNLPAQLCALNPTPTNYIGKDDMPPATDLWTYEKDGALILALWILQLLCCCCTCCGSAIYPISAKPGM
jgi:hypothetical protein